MADIEQLGIQLRVMRILTSYTCGWTSTAFCVARKLVEKAPTSGNKKACSYQITEAGIENTDRYTHTRKNILIKMFSNRAGLNVENLTETMI